VAESAAIQRRLARLSGPDGLVLGIALDHRDSFRVAMARAGRETSVPELISAIKVDLVRELAPLATAIMLDSEYGSRALDAGLVPPGVALIMPLEKQGYEDVEGASVTTLMEDFSPEVAAARYAADACKLLLPLRMDHAASRDRQMRVVVESATACHRQGLPLVVEPVVHRMAGEDQASFAASYPQLVAAAAESTAGWGADLLKLPFPSLQREEGASEACAALTRACAGKPWALLGAGAVAKAFEWQVQLAVRAGAVGFLVGRSVWGDSIAAGSEERIQAIRTTAVPAFESFCQAARGARNRPAARS
jgi:tagatose-1,6-bisphosphate aldolase